MSSNFLYKKNDYLTFDATTMRDLIVSRLNESQIFSDQNYAGSNLSALTDVMSVIFGSLMFYLNKTSSESLFSESQIYENINRIVKILNYNPAGRFTQNVLINLTALADLPIGSYVIPRYSYTFVGPYSYTFNQDVFFSKTTDGIELIESLSNNCLMYQGGFQEYTGYIASGIENESITLPTVEALSIDHLNIHVYTKNSLTQKWIQWERTEDLYGSFPEDLKYEVRFNENKTYEIKFGDGINGKKLTQADEVSVFYLICNPKAPSVGPGALSAANKLKLFNSNNFNSIIRDVQNINISTYPVNNFNFLKLNNSFSSTDFIQEESVEQIKRNAPKVFNSQKRLVINDDYKHFILSQFPGLVKDVSIFNNEEYMESHLKYLYDIGLSSPYLKKSILYNQVKFASTCNFNNIYAYLLPQSPLLTSLNYPQKQLILKEVNKYKTLTSKIVPMEPENFYIDFYIKNPDIDVSVKDLNQCKLLLIKNKNGNRTNASIKLEAKSIIENYFDFNNLKLGYFLNITELSSLLSNISGVSKIQTSRKDINLNLNQLSFLLWNESYPDLDCSICSQNTQFESFKFVKFFQIDNLLNKIDVI